MAPYGAGAETCGDFRRGLCTRGNYCRYIHAGADGNAGGGYGGHGSHSWYGQGAAGTWSPWDSGDRTGSWAAGQHMGNWAAAAARLEAHAVAAAAAEPARVIALQELLLPEQLPAAVAQPAGAAAAVAGVLAQPPQ